MLTPFYDPELSYEDNFDQGPFGLFASEPDFESPKLPPTQVLGQQLQLPFGIPAGPLINAAYVKAAFKWGFDVAVYKTVRSRSHPCHPQPNVVPVRVGEKLTLQQAAAGVKAGTKYQAPLSITNSFGVPSMDPDWWQPDMAQAIAAAGPGQLMIASFQGTRVEGQPAGGLIDDYVATAKLVAETKPPIMVANLSCPNEGTGNLVCFDLPTVTKLASRIKNQVPDIPLLLKTAYFQDHSALEKLVTEVGPIVDGFITINTIPAKVFDAAGNQALPGPGRQVSGVCGAAIKWAGLEMVERLVQLKAEKGIDFVVIGSGGVVSPADYTEYRAAGADAVMSATGAMWNPRLALEVKQQVAAGDK